RFNFWDFLRPIQRNYAGLGIPFRPILFDFNGVYQPHLSKKAGVDLMGGIGWQSTRFYGYQPTSNCVFFGACYTSSNHFLVDVGGGIRYYVRGHVFVRPEAHFYHIVNNTSDFSSNNLVRVGASIGYTIGPDESGASDDGRPARDLQFRGPGGDSCLLKLLAACSRGLGI